MDFQSHSKNLLFAKLLFEINEKMAVLVKQDDMERVNAIWTVKPFLFSTSQFFDEAAVPAATGTASIEKEREVRFEELQF